MNRLAMHSPETGTAGYPSSKSLYRGDVEMFTEFVGQTVVIDLRSQFVCLGTLERFDGEAVWLRDADMHDLRDSDTSRENYIAASLTSGIKRNRKAVVLSRAEVVAVSKFADVVDE